jgi:hypothetical protein
MKLFRNKEQILADKEALRRRDLMMQIMNMCKNEGYELTMNIGLRPIQYEEKNDKK